MSISYPTLNYRNACRYKIELRRLMKELRTVGWPLFLPEPSKNAHTTFRYAVVSSRKDFSWMPSLAADALHELCLPQVDPQPSSFSCFVYFGQNRLRFTGRIREECDVVSKTKILVKSDLSQWGGGDTTLWLLLQRRQNRRQTKLKRPPLNRPTNERFLAIS